MQVSQLLENWSWAHATIACGVVLVIVALLRYARDVEAAFGALAKRFGYVSRRSAEVARLERLRNLDPPNRRRKLH